MALQTLFLFLFGLEKFTKMQNYKLDIFHYFSKNVENPQTRRVAHYHLLQEWKFYSLCDSIVVIIKLLPNLTH